jgi:competence protein ComEC
MKNKQLLIICLLIANIYLLNNLFSKPKATFYFPQVGNADACIIKTGRNQVILVDTGKNKDILNHLGKELPFWKREIDLIILSHAHNDHYGGIEDILKRYKVKYFAFNGIPSPNNQFKSAYSKLVESGADILVIYRGVLIKINEDENITTYWPPKENNSKDLNNSSLVQKYYINSRSVFLFTGDVDAKILGNINDDLSAGYIKVPHHGSKNSLNQEVIEKVSPQYAIISSGKNSYGHPSKEVISLLDINEIKIFITNNGSIKISCLFDGYCYN